MASFWTTYKHDIANDTFRGPDFKMDGVPVVAKATTGNKVFVAKFNSGPAGARPIAIYEGDPGKNPFRYVWLSLTPNGAPLAGPTSQFQAKGITSGMGMTLQLDVGDTIKSVPGAWFQPQYFELAPNTDYWLNIVTPDYDGKVAYKGYP